MRLGLIGRLAPPPPVALAACLACGGTTATSPAHDGGESDRATIDAPPEATSDDSGSIPDAGTPDASACSTGDAACNSLRVCGPEITLANVMTPAPQPAGGTIAPGTYLLTAITFFPTGPQSQSATFRMVIQISETGADAGMLLVQEIIQQPPSAPATDTWAVAVQPPSTLAWTSTCGGVANARFGYSATSSSLDLFANDPGGPGTTVTTFAKQ
jgi:hypothetical protein